MNTNATIALTQTAADKAANRVQVIVNGETIATVKDGGNRIIANTDRHLRAHGILRSSGYQSATTATGHSLTATGYTLGR